MDTVIRPHSLAAPRLAAPRARLALFVANAIVLVGALVFVDTVQPAGTVMRVGQVAGATVVADRRVPYRDSVATAAKRLAATQAVTPVYRFDPSREERRVREAATFLAGAGPILAGGQTVPQKLAALRRLLPPGISGADLQQFPAITPTDLQVVRERSSALLSQATGWRFDSNQRMTTEIGLLSTIAPHVTVAQRNAIGEILSTFLTPTLVEDMTATLAKHRQVAARVAPVYGTIYPGEVIVRRGDLVTTTIMDKLKALGFKTSHTGWQDVSASLLFSSIIVAMLFWYLHSFHSQIVTNGRLLLLIDASILATVLGARVLAAGHVLLPYFLPVATASTFAAVLVAPEACIAVVLALAVLAGWVVANSFELTMYYFLSGAAGVLAIRQVHRIKQFILAGAYITLFALATALAFGLIGQSYDLAALQEYVLAAVFNGFVSSTLALGGFALLSGFFGVTTTLHLLELAQPSQPLLRRLTTKAAGTYNHSLIVASMAERAAEEIGANSMVAKVAALYHDVGKTANPHCFTENQLGIANIHDELKPDESARIIRGHVAQGVRLARQHRLPRVVVDAICEHHGTMTIAYFLHKARQEGPIADLSLYSYPGPKPQTKETALLMLADGCESTVRASPDHSPEKIEEIVERIFRERAEWGQLDECPLTMHDLERAKVAFCAVLNGLYHPRIEYPEPVETAVERRLRSPQGSEAP